MPEDEDKFKGLLYSPEVLGGIGLLTQGLSGAAPSAALPSLLQGMQTASLFKKQKTADERAKFIKQYEDQVPPDQLPAFRAFPEKWVEQNLFAKNKGSKFETFLSPNGEDKVTINTNTKAGLLRSEELTNDINKYNKISQSVTGKTTGDLVPKKTAGKLDEEIMNSENFAITLKNIDEMAEDKFMTYMGQGEAWLTGQAQKLNINTSKEANNFVNRYSAWKSDVLKNTNQYRKYITGVAAGGKEIVLLKNSIANPDDPPSVFKAKVKTQRIMNDIITRRNKAYKALGVGELTTDSEGKPTGKYKEYLELPENQITVNKEMAVTYAETLVDGGYENKQVQLKLEQVFGAENMDMVNKYILEELK